MLLYKQSSPEKILDPPPYERLVWRDITSMQVPIQSGKFYADLAGNDPSQEYVKRLYNVGKPNIPDGTLLKKSLIEKKLTGVCTSPKTYWSLLKKLWNNKNLKNIPCILSFFLVNSSMVFSSSDLICYANENWLIFKMAKAALHRCS